MIVPRTRLLIWTGIVVVPGATLAGAVPEAAVLAVVALAGFLAVVLYDAVRAVGRLEDISVTWPALQRLTKDQDGSLELHLTWEQPHTKNLRVGLRLPNTLHTPHTDLGIDLPADGHSQRLRWPVTPRQRGNYLLDTCYLEGTSPLGFWAVRATVAAPGEVRVYPNLSSERQHLAAFFMQRTGFGVHTQRQMGKGHEFEKLRKYVPGDSYEDLHWKATAKRGYPVTKVFQVERTQEVYVILDASRLSSRRAPGSDVETLLERFVTAALVMALAAEKQGDRFGLLAYGDGVQRFVPARSGKAHYTICRDALYTLQPHRATPDFDELYTFIRLRLRRRALLLFLTSLDDPLVAESFVRHINLICQHHLLFVGMLPPTPVQPVFSQPNITAVDDIYQHLGSHFLWHELHELSKVLQRHGVQFTLLNNAAMCAQLVSHYVTIKQRQLL